MFKQISWIQDAREHCQHAIDGRLSTSFTFGDLCLAHTVEVEAPRAGFELTNYGEYLDRAHRSLK